MPYFVHWLTNCKNYDYDYTYENMLLYEGDNPEINRLFNEFLDWFCEEKEPNGS